MSAFTNLKKNRQQKETKSFIVPNDDNDPAASHGSTRDVHADNRHTITEEEDNKETMVQDEPSTAGPVPFRIDGLYVSLPPTLDLRIDAQMGRGVYSTHARRPGEVLASIKPHVAALSNGHLEGYCSKCFGPGQHLRRCTGCKVVSYCDTECQTADWSFHKSECTAIQRWMVQSQSRVEEEEVPGSTSTPGTPTIPGDAMRCLGRILWRKQKLGEENVCSKEIDAMQSHRTSLSKDPNAQDAQTHAQLAHAIVRFLGITGPDDMARYGLKSTADLVDLISRFTTNTFTVSTPSLAPLGACVSPLAALINHSCDPNAVIVFPRAAGQQKTQEPLMQLIAIKPIAPDEQVLTSYIDSTLPRELRQKILKETYHFTCRCRLCDPPLDSNSNPEQGLDWREVMWCPKRCGGVCPLPTEENSLVRCSKCRAPVRDTDAVLDAVRIGQEALDKAEALQFSNPQKSIQLTSKLIPILISAGVVPSAHPLLGLSRLYTSLLITDRPFHDAQVTAQLVSPGVAAASSSSSATATATGDSAQRAQEKLDEAIRAATRSTYALAQILCQGHPIRGVAFAELGKLVAVDEPCPVHAIGSSESDLGGASSKSPPPTPTPSSMPPHVYAMSPLTSGHIGSSGGGMYPPSGAARLKMAYEILIRARQELMVGFGGGRNEGGEVGVEVRKLIVEVEKELSVWKERLRDVWVDRERGKVKVKG